MILSTFLVAVPQKTHAQYVDIANTLKEYGLDTVGYTAAQIVLKKLTAKTVNWINSGFKGNPAYPTNPKQFFLDVGDDVASNILSSTKLNKICAPFKAKVRIALVKNYLSEDENYSCTLTTLKNNYDAFTQDFSQGGWNGWFEVTQNSGGNPFGVYFSAQSELLKKVSNEKGEYKTELEQGKGILSLKRCPPAGLVTQAMIDQTKALIAMGNLKAENSAVAGKKVGDCTVPKETVTPGTLINDQLTKSLGATWEKLGAADEISEIMTALVTQLVEKALGSAKGLRGTSEKPGTGGQSDTEKLANEREPAPKVDPNTINRSIEQGGINCSSSSSSSADGGGEENGASSSSFSSNCSSTETTVQLPNIDFGGGGAGGGGGSCPVPTTPKSLCEKVDQGVVLAILNKYRPSNAGITAAIVEVQGVYPQAKVIPHTRLDKIDFGGGLVVDVIIGAVGGTAEGKGWGWGVDCECGNTGTAPGTGNAISADDFLGGGSAGDESGSPASLLEDVRAERAKFGANVVGADLGKLLNAVAWKNRTSGWGLSRKDFGQQCSSPVGQIACDILYHKPTNTIYDVLVAAGEISTPTWDELGENTDARRPWVAPVQP